MPQRFAAMVEQHLDHLESPASPHKVSQTAYEQWAAGFVFEAIRDQRYGQSFCNRFNIKDHVLYYQRDLTRADIYIRQHYVQ